MTTLEDIDATILDLDQILLEHGRRAPGMYDILITADFVRQLLVYMRELRTVRADQETYARRHQWRQEWPGGYRAEEPEAAAGPSGFEDVFSEFMRSGFGAGFRDYYSKKRPDEKQQGESGFGEEDQKKREERARQHRAYQEAEDARARDRAEQERARAREEEARRRYYETLRQTQAEEPWYKTLGVDVRADKKTITKAYRRLAMKYHPDRAGVSPDASAEMFKKIKAAYEKGIGGL